MNMRVKFTGIENDIVEDAIRKGFAKTKSQVLRLALLELNRKYNLLKN